MNANRVRKQAFPIPMTSAAFPPGPGAVLVIVGVYCTTGIV
jgi:acetoacetate decarboxylase